MNLAQIVLRKLPTSKSNFLCYNTVSKSIICHKSTKGPSSSSSSSSSSGSDSDEDIKKKTSRDAVTRLNTLLQQMVSDDSKSTIELAQPVNKRDIGRKEKEAAANESEERKVAKAVKDVAETLGGNTKQTESELIMKLLNPVETSDGTSNSLSDILKGMKIERDVKPQQSKAEQVRSVLQQVSARPRTQERPAEQRRPRRVHAPLGINDIKPQTVELFGNESLEIFTNPSELKESAQLPTWQKLHEKELKLAVTHPPANYFQQMILWTEQGKFWQFPINNEFGLEEESKVYFADHVFLEEHLEPWCPQRGPIRHFMELVCVGLSKNSYLTVEAKKEHIEWFRKYFEDKRKLLEEVGAVERGQLEPKSLESS